MAKRVSIKTTADALAYLESVDAHISHYRQHATDPDRCTAEIVCGRCGGRGYGPWRQDGGICYDCGGKNSRYTTTFTWVDVAKKVRRQELAAARRRRNAEAKHKAKVDARNAAVVDFDAAFPGFRDALAPYLETTEGDAGGCVFVRQHSVLNDMALRLDQWGSLSEKQVAFAQKMIDEANAPKGEIAEGRYEITGKVLKARWYDNNYGTALKMVVKLEDGTRVFSTVPRDIMTAVTDYMRDDANVAAIAALSDRLGCRAEISDVIKGAAVTFTATVTRSDDSPDFGFAKRPACGSVTVALPVPRCDHCDGAHATKYCPGEAYEAARMAADH